MEETYYSGGKSIGIVKIDEGDVWINAVNENKGGRWTINVKYENWRKLLKITQLVKIRFVDWNESIAWKFK